MASSSTNQKQESRLLSASMCSQRCIEFDCVAFGTEMLSRCFEIEIDAPNAGSQLLKYEYLDCYSFDIIVYYILFVV